MRPGFTSLFVLSLFAFAPPSFADDCKHSRWGAEDQIGNANLITSKSVLAASKLIKTGKTYALGIIIDADTPAFPPRSLSLQVVQPGQQMGRAALPNAIYNDDLVQMWLGIGPQIDGLGHLGSDGNYYNCNKAEDISDINGLTRLGIENVPPLVTRGIVLDMAAHFGVEFMNAGQFFTVQDVKAVEKKQGTPVREGDVVLFHTGWTDAKLKSDPDAWLSGEPGQSEEVAQYLASKNVVAVGADTWGVDVVPTPDPDRPFQGHVILLKENGIYTLETMNTGPLVRDRAFEFMFVLGPARLRGAVQMIINPIAIH
ncbi:MAG: cyclase family protein [Gammaproteobacteria bacterium]|nr:MAG: cyclase family protein [Gammaproteobacteria bacterium]TDJ42646.1 MAG: cyclase family protein [Gammaproteobacteria bacterium]